MSEGQKGAKEVGGARRRTGITLPHTLSEFDVGLLVLVVCERVGEQEIAKELASSALPDLASALVITSCERSTLFWRRSEMVCFVYSSAPLTSRSMSILRRQVSMTVTTSRQLSRRTVCGKGQDVRGSGRSASTHLDSLGVHLVPLVWLRPVEPSVSFLTDEEVREVDFFELEFDGCDELSGDKLCGFGTCESRPQDGAHEP